MHIPKIKESVYGKNKLDARRITKETSPLFNNGKTPERQSAGFRDDGYGFTLIELLIVVLIIGILSAVAVPQYQKAVLKAQYSTLKDRTRTLAQAQQRHYLATGEYATELAELDVDFAITSELKQETSFYIYFSEGNHGTLCGKNIFGTKMRYSQNHEGTYRVCVVYSTNENDIFHQLCKNETGKAGTRAGSRYDYYY